MRILLVLAAFSVVNVLSYLYCGSQPVQFNLESQQLPKCLFKNSLSPFSVVSNLQVNENAAVPDSQGWSHCRGCIWNQGLFYVSGEISGKSNGKEHVDLTWSLWGEFFHAYKNDRLRGNIIPEFQVVKENLGSTFIIETPVYVIPVITLHVGHLLIDVLEQIYSSMINTYGQVRKDSLIILDVANADERAILQEKLYRQSNAGDVDTMAMSLHLLSDNPILSMDFFQTLQEFDITLIFESIHFGLDISSSYYYRGFRHHPCQFNPSSSEVQELSARYKNFQSFMWNITHLFPAETADRITGMLTTPASFRELSVTASGQRVVANRKLNVAVIQRQKNRVIENLDQLLQSVPVSFLSELNVQVVDLDNVTLSEQLLLFASIDILVAAAGTAVHNTLFMRPGTAVIILMQSNWCEYSWLYSNQAILLDIEPFVYCSRSDSGEEEISRTWTRKFWKQGPRMTKSANISIPVDGFVAHLLKAKRVVVEQTQIKDKQSVCYGPQVASDLTTATYLDSSKVKISSNSKLQSTFVPKVEVFLSSVGSEYLGQGKWKLSLMGEISSRVLDLSMSLPSMFHLSICFDSMLSVMTPFCYPLSSYNYYSELFITVNNPVLHLHFWLQTAKNGGKIRGSDCFVALDTRLGSTAGFELQEKTVGRRHTQKLTFIHLNGSYFYPTSRILRATNFNQSDAIVDLLVDEPMLHRHSLQRMTSEFCRNFSLSFEDCGNLAEDLTRWLFQAELIRSLSLPPLQLVPSPRNPFVFLHVEKSAGTTLREFIEESALSHSVDYFIPCHGGVHCVTLGVRINDTRVSNRTSVLAGHFSWGVWNNLPVFLSNDSSPVSNSDISDGARPTPSCFVMGRHPLDRAISYYYDRCYASESCVGKGKMINELTVEELSLVAVSTRNAEKSEDGKLYVVDDGMSDAACRAITGTKVTSGLQVINGEIKVRVPEVLSDDVVRLALRNADTCVVGLLEKWSDTKRIMAHWFPWIEMNRKDANRRKMHKYKEKETSATLRPDLALFLLKENGCDLKLYARMVELFQRQLEVLDTSAYVPNY